MPCIHHASMDMRLRRAPAQHNLLRHHITPSLLCAYRRSQRTRFTIPVMPPRQVVAAGSERRNAMRGAAAELRREAERAECALLAEADSAGDASAEEAASLLRRLDVLAGALQRARDIVTAQRDAPAADGFLLALPLPLPQRIWSSLPVDTRMRCREVCRAWRFALAAPRLWTELDLTAASGVVAHVTPELLRAAAARAGGHLEGLRVQYFHDCCHDIAPPLLDVVAANADTLRYIRLERGYISAAVWLLEPLMRAVLRQCVVDADVQAGHQNAGSMLRNEHPFQALRLRSLDFNGDDNMVAADVEAFAADIAAHPSLQELTLHNVALNTFAALDAVVDAALALRVPKLQLIGCRAGPASAIALPRLLRANALLELEVHQDTPVLDAHAAALVADSLRSNHSLTTLTLRGVRTWGGGRVGADAVLLSALVGHASLTSIALRTAIDDNDSATVGAQLGALVTADSPLRVLDLSNNDLDDDSLGPLVDALPRNTHLLELNISGNDMSDAFAQDRLMPALAANTALQTLQSGHSEPDDFIAARTTVMTADARAGLTA